MQLGDAQRQRQAEAGAFLGAGEMACTWAKGFIASTICSWVMPTPVSAMAMVTPPSLAALAITRMRPLFGGELLALEAD